MNNLSQTINNLFSLNEVEPQNKITHDAHELYHAIISKKPIKEIAPRINKSLVNELVNRKYLLHVAIEAGRDDVVAVFAKYPNLDLSLTERVTKNTCFHLAVIQNSKAMISDLGARATPNDLERINEYGLTPFLLACKDGKTEAAFALKELGANIDVRGGPLNQTALHYAAAKSDEAFMELFKQRPDLVNATITTGYPGATPFHVACKTGRAKMIPPLLDMGASLDATYVQADQEGFTGLHAAALYDQPQCIEFFKDRHDLLHAKTKNGKTAQEIALRKQNHRCVRELLKYGVEPEWSLLSVDTLSSISMRDVYTENHPSVVQRALAMISDSISLENEYTILGCLKVYFLLTSNKCDIARPLLAETEESCNKLFAFIKGRQIKRVNAAIATVMGTDLATTEEDLLAILETLSFQHHFTSLSLPNTYYQKVAKLNIRVLVLFDPLQKVLKTLAGHVKEKQHQLTQNDFAEKIDHITRLINHSLKLQKELAPKAYCYLESRFTQIIRQLKDLE